MLVADYMSKPVVTVSAGTPVAAALKTMQARGIRRLPVLDEHERLVGIVSDKDLLHASPSPATSLSIWEIADLLGRLTVGEIMTRDVVTVTPDSPLEDAAQLMVDRKIGGLPVVADGRVVGVITETDIFKVFCQLVRAGAVAPAGRP